jgi:hypothetical protein
MLVDGTSARCSAGRAAAAAAAAPLRAPRRPRCPSQQAQWRGETVEVERAQEAPCREAAGFDVVHGLSPAQNIVPYRPRRSVRGRGAAELEPPFRFPAAPSTLGEAGRSSLRVLFGATAARARRRRRGTPAATVRAPRQATTPGGDCARARHRSPRAPATPAAAAAGRGGCGRGERDAAVGGAERRRLPRGPAPAAGARARGGRVLLEGGRGRAGRTGALFALRAPSRRRSARARAAPRGSTDCRSIGPAVRRPRPRAPPPPRPCWRASRRSRRSAPRA